MSLIRDPKNVWCHVVSEEIRATNVRDWSAGHITCTIYDSKNAAVEDLKGFVRALLVADGPHPEVSDYTNDASHPRIEWTDAYTGKRMKRWVTDLPFFHG